MFYINLTKSLIPFKGLNIALKNKTTVYDSRMWEIWCKVLFFILQCIFKIKLFIYINFTECFKILKCKLSLNVSFYVTSGNNKFQGDLKDTYKNKSFPEQDNRWTIKQMGTYMRAKTAEVPKSILWLWLALGLNSYIPKSLDLEQD